MNSAGLRILRLEFGQVLKLRHGPFKSGGHPNALRQPAQEMSQVSDYDCNLSFELLYEDVAAQMRVPGQVGSPEHMQQVWRSMQSYLTAPAKGTNIRTSRWWNFAENSRASLSKHVAIQLNLLWLGFSPWILDKL